jgi:alcohol dehydrogenase, propanol-preferring
VPDAGEVRINVSACGVCRTDLHVVDGELPDLRYPIVPGHEVVGRIDVVGTGVSGLAQGMRVGVPWLGWTCGHCAYCEGGQENLCDRPQFTGYTRDGGFATHLVADARYCFPLGEDGDDTALAPLLCAGLIGWRSLVMAGGGKHLGIYGFGAAGHIVAQLAHWQGRLVYAFTRKGDEEAQALARSLGAVWAGASEDAPPAPLDAAIIYAPVGALVPLALGAVRKGGRVVCAGIHMSDNRIRIAGQLIDAETGAHLWADRFEGPLEDIFDLQDQVTSSVVGAIAPTLQSEEIKRARRSQPRIWMHTAITCVGWQALVGGPRIAL